MDIWRMLAILGCVALISLGQILFKYSALRVGPHGGLWALMTSPTLIAAGVIYVGATLIWVMQLKYVPLNRAYPLFATAFVLVPLLGHWLFDERLSLSYMLGALLIVSGVVLCSWYY